ncbi:MAG: CHAT domain-containing protein, partial [Candidatus Zixiibacteriota bacterium]
MPAEFKGLELCFKKVSNNKYKAWVPGTKSKPHAESSFSMRLDTLKMREDLQKLEELALSSKPVTDDLHIKFGKELFHTVFKDELRDYYEKTLKKARDNGGLRLRIRVDDNAKELMNLPWEFMHDGDDFLVTKRETLLSRLPLSIEKKKKKPLNEAISMLIVISSPLDLPENKVLNTEKEQEVILEALDRLQRERKLDIDFVEDASLDTIQDYLTEKDYHILHFTGHGIFKEDEEKGYLLLEDEDGNRREVEGEDIADILSNYKSLRLVFLSSCQTAKASNIRAYPDVSRKLLNRGIPSVVSMQHSILDRSATDFAYRFYHSIASGNAVDVALADARVALYKGEKKNRVDFATPALFLNDPDCISIKKIKAKKKKSKVKAKAVSLGEIQVMKKGFVGRRKELRVMRKGFESDNKRAFIIHGFGGIGKSVLATRLALKMEEHFDGAKGIRFRPTTKPEDILNELNAFLNMAGINAFNEYIHQSIPMDAKTDVLANILNQVRFLLIFDNFEDVLSGDGKREIANPDLRKFIQRLLNGVAENSKFIFTTRHDFDPLDRRLAGAVDTIQLAELPFPMAVFLMNNFTELESLSIQKKLEIYQKIGGHPYYLGLFVEHVRRSSVDKVLKELAPVQKDMIEFTLLDKIYEKLSDGTKTLLKKASIFEEAVPLEGLIALTVDMKNKKPDISNELDSLIGWGLMVKGQEISYCEDKGKIKEVKEDTCILHQLVKDFAKEKLDEDQSKFLIKAAKFYESYSEKTKSIWDLLRARDYYFEAEEYEKADDIVEGSIELLERWGYIQLAMKLLNESVATLEGKTKMIAMGNLGYMYQLVGDLETAKSIHKEMQELCIKTGDKRNLAIALHQLGIIHQDQGNYKEAVSKYEESLRIKKELGDKSGIAKTLHQLGMIHRNQGNYKEAVSKYEESLRIKKELGDKSGIA